MRPFSRFLVAVFTLVGVSNAFADTPLDVVGIKVGMPLTQALDALKAHNPRMKVFPYGSTVPASVSNLDQAQTRAFGRLMPAEYKGLPPFIWHVLTQSEDLKATADVRQEAIDLYLAPGSPEVVVGIRRYVVYQAGHERTIATLLAGLTEKYGPSPASNPGPSGKPKLLVWYYDATGRPVVRSGTGSPEFPGPCNDVQSLSRGPSVGNDRYLPSRDQSASIAQKCGAFAYAEIEEFYGAIVNGRRLPANWDLARSIAVTVADMALSAGRYNAAVDIVENFAKGQQQQQTGEATKRREKF